MLPVLLKPPDPAEAGVTQFATRPIKNTLTNRKEPIGLQQFVFAEIMVASQRRLEGTRIRVVLAVLVEFTQGVPTIMESRWIFRRWGE
jgi:arginine deiminase